MKIAEIRKFLKENPNDVKDVTMVTYKRRTGGKKPVNQYDDKMNLIKSWDSISAAAKAHGVSVQTIFSACNKKQKMVCGFIWEYK